MGESESESSSESSSTSSGTSSSSALSVTTELPFGKQKADGHKHEISISAAVSPLVRVSAPGETQSSLFAAAAPTTAPPDPKEKMVANPMDYSGLQRLLTAPVGVRRRERIPDSSSAENTRPSTSGDDPKSKTQTARPGTTPGLLHR